MKKYFINIGITFLVSWCSSMTYSQEYDPYTYENIEEESSLSDKVFFGGGLDLQFGTYTVIKLTPELGYRVSPTFELGVGVYFLYLKNFSSNFSASVYGGKLFSRYYILDNLVLIGEAETLFVLDYAGSRVMVHGLLGGVGYQQKLGDRFAIQTSILYNFLMSENTPYQNPIIRISFVY